MRLFNISCCNHPHAFFVACMLLMGHAASRADEPQIPEVLKPWENWVTWGVKHQDCPKVYSNASEPICFWPSRLDLSASADAGTWTMAVNVFEETWVPLPGSADIWPVNVRAGEELVVVVQREGHPEVKLARRTTNAAGRVSLERNATEDCDPEADWPPLTCRRRQRSSGTELGRQQRSVVETYAQRAGRQGPARGTGLPADRRRHPDLVANRHRSDRFG